MKIVLVTPIGERPSLTQLQEVQIHATLSKPIRRARLQDCLDQATLQPPAHVWEKRTGTTAVEPRAARILLAEDNPVNRKLAVAQLQKLGYPVDAVCNGREVIDALQQKPYDIVLMDGRMPELNGCETTLEIRRQEHENDGRVPGQENRLYIIALTASALQGDRERYVAAGINDYLSKPVQLKELDAALSRWNTVHARLRPDDGEGSPASRVTRDTGLEVLGTPAALESCPSSALAVLPHALAA